MKVVCMMEDGLQCCARFPVLYYAVVASRSMPHLNHFHLQVLQELQAKQQLRSAFQPAGQLSALFAGPKAAQKPAAFSFGFCKLCCPVGNR